MLRGSTGHLCFENAKMNSYSNSYIHASAWCHVPCARALGCSSVSHMYIWSFRRTHADTISIIFLYIRQFEWCGISLCIVRRSGSGAPVPSQQNTSELFRSVDVLWIASDFHCLHSLFIIVRFRCAPATAKRFSIMRWKSNSRRKSNERFSQIPKTYNTNSTYIYIYV